MTSIDLNCDVGEGFGPWMLGDDEGVMPHVTSASIAAGFHAGDPVTIRRTIEAAARYGVDVGAHVGLPDRLGFGRREMRVDPDELRDYVVYQVGAVAAFARALGRPLAHVKPHGALYVMAAREAAITAALAVAIAEVSPGLPLVLATAHVEAAAEHGIEVVTEAFPDLDYGADGGIILERPKRARDPEQVAQRAVRIVRERRLTAVDGSEVELEARTLCIHGDAPNAAQVAAAVRRALEAEGVCVEPLAAEVSGRSQEEQR